MRPDPTPAQKKRHAQGKCAAPGCEEKPRINPATGWIYWLCWSHAQPVEPTEWKVTQLPKERPRRVRQTVALHNKRKNKGRMK
jgi:hypothetical protein